MPAYKDKKKGTWYAAFYYVNWNGERKHTCKRGFKTQREAKEYERTFINKMTGRADITFANLVENYLADMETRLKPTTMQNKRHVIESHLLPVFGRLQICDIDSLTIRRWQADLLSYTDKDGNVYAQTYLKTLNTQLSTIMNYAVRHYGLLSNPCHKAGYIGKNKADEMRIWTEDEYKIFRSHLKKTRMKVAFDILFYTGMRMGELLALTGEDILEDGFIRINKNFAVVDGEQLFLTPKTEKSIRTISIPDFLLREILDYAGYLYGFQPQDRIFDMTKGALQKEIHRVADLAGLEHIRVHDLRHSHASLLIHMGVHIKQISERLGHDSVKTTLDTYSHLYPNSDRELALMLDIRDPDRE